MDITTTLNEITALSIEDRIRLVQAIWDSIAAEQVYPDLTEVQKRELDYRIDDYEINPDNVLTWEEIKASVKVISENNFTNDKGASLAPLR
ncbi:MAG: addiction module protein [Calothrix sp. MO_192.B10]|nr:addiction module protein [Calothrix sp. MO_192.B10]